MYPKGVRSNGIAFDLENGITAPEDPAWGVKREKQLLSRAWSSFANAERAVRSEEAGSIGHILFSHVDIPAESGESERKYGSEENVAVAGKKMGDENPKRKNKACQKASKPPRPPRASSLDPADQRLIREISELAMLKRARMERMKALKKMKNARASSSKSNFWALVITILFCLVIFWQGLCPKGHSNVQFEGSPEASIRTRGGMISVQQFRNVSPINNDSASAFPGITEPVSGLGFNGEGDVSRTAG